MLSLLAPWLARGATPGNTTEFKRLAAPFRGLFWSTSGQRLAHFGEQLRRVAFASGALARQARDAAKYHGIKTVSGALFGAFLEHCWATFGHTLANNVVSSSSLLAPWLAPKGLRTASPHEREQRSETQRNSSGQRRSLGAFLEHLWPTFGPSFGNNFVS